MRARHSLVRDRAAAGRPAPDTVRKAIEIGSRVIEQRGDRGERRLRRREVEQGLGELHGRLGETLEEGAEALAERIA